MQFAVHGEADTPDALDALAAAIESWLKYIGAAIVERDRDDEDLRVAFIIRSQRDVTSLMLDANLPGKVGVEPLD